MFIRFSLPARPSTPDARGYHAVYRDGEVNHCPGCGRTHWLIGRLSAECAFCTTALPLRKRNQGPAPHVRFWSGAPGLCGAQRRVSLLNFPYFPIMGPGLYSRRMGRL